MHRARFSKFVFLFFLVLNLAIFVYPQEKSNNAPSNPAEITEPVKFDEFGDISEKEFAPKLRNYRLALQKNINLRGLIVFYPSFNGSLFQQTFYFERRKTQIYNRYVEIHYGPLVMFTKGGFRERQTTELWLLPSDGKFPEITTSQYKPPFDPGSVPLELLSAEELNFRDAKNERSEETEIEDEIENEDVRTDEEIKNDQDINSAQEETRAEQEAKIEERLPGDCLGIGETLKQNKFHEDLSRILDKNLNWRGVLIYYADDAEFDLKVLQQNIDNLLNAKKIDMRRVKLIYGGYRDYAQIETWIVPRNGIEPEVMPDEKFDEN